MNLNGCRECKFYIIDNSCQIICNYNGKINYLNVYEGKARNNVVLSCPRIKSAVVI